MAVRLLKSGLPRPAMTVELTLQLVAYHQLHNETANGRMPNDGTNDIRES